MAGVHYNLHKQFLFYQVLQMRIPHVPVLVFLLLLATNFCYSQVEKTIGSGTSQRKKLTFAQFDISLAFQPNEQFDQPTLNGERRQSRFVPVGIASNIGYGIHYKQWIGLSANAGLIFIGNEKLVAVPAYLNIRLSPKISEDSRITLQYGLGQSFAIGRGNLNGTYQKISVGYENNDGNLIFVAIEGHGYGTVNINSHVGTLSLGLALISF